MNMVSQLVYSYAYGMYYILFNKGWMSYPMVSHENGRPIMWDPIIGQVKMVYFSILKQFPRSKKFMLIRRMQGSKLFQEGIKVTVACSPYIQIIWLPVEKNLIFFYNLHPCRMRIYTSTCPHAIFTKEREMFQNYSSLQELGVQKNYKTGLMNIRF